MLKQLLGTAGTRVLNAVINICILILLTNKIGSEGLGVIGLIMLDITIIQLAIDMVAGSAVIYYASRHHLGALVFPAYIWILAVILFFIIAGIIVSKLFPLFYEVVIPSGFSRDIIALSLLNAIMLLHYNILLGKKKINTYNRIFSIQILSMLGIFLIQIYYLKNLSVTAYTWALYVAYGIGAVSSLFTAYRGSGPFIISGWRHTLGQVLHYGLSTQLANILHMGNKRLSFFLIKYFSGLKSLGVYTAGTQISEGLRLIGQSISMVQFSTISNTNDKEYARILTIKLMKFTVLLTAAAVLCLLLIPFSTYAFIFSSDFSQIKVVIYALSPGIIALSMTTIFSGYFSGRGMPNINLVSNVIGFMFTIIFAVLLIPIWGYTGAALTASASFTASTIYQYIIFWQHTGTQYFEWLPRKNDFTDFKQIVRTALKR